MLFFFHESSLRPLLSCTQSRETPSRRFVAALRKATTLPKRTTGKRRPVISVQPPLPHTDSACDLESEDAMHAVGHHYHLRSRTAAAAAARTPTPPTSVGSAIATTSFVARNVAGSVYDDELVEDMEDTICRSTPSPNLQFFTVAGGALEAVNMDSTMEFKDEMDTVMDHIDTQQPTQPFQQTPPLPPARNHQFTSIAHKFPLSMKTEDSARVAFHGKSAMKSDPATRSTASGFVQASSLIHDNQEVTQRYIESSFEQSFSMKRDLEEYRQSPFGPVQSLEGPYSCNLPDNIVQEMKQKQWELLEKRFNHYFELKSREPQWGRMEMRAPDNRILFYPGKRREAILTERKFHEDKYQEAMASQGGDPSYSKARLADLDWIYHEFCAEEAKYKQELTLARLEKASPFSKIPYVANRFCLIRLLGKGGNGEVWEVMDFAHDRQICALKISSSKQHAQREYMTHSKLKHDGIIRVGDSAYIIQHEDKLYTCFTVENAETDLQHMLEMRGHFDEPTALLILSSLLISMKYLHAEMGIAHYDLKPSNILISKDNCIKLTDFDLARDINAPVAPSTVGTLRYLPPECFHPQSATADFTAEKADIWMLGIIFCILLTGKHPICGSKSTPEQTRAEIGSYNGRLKFQPHPHHDISRSIISRCLHPNPTVRPDVASLLQALHEYSASVQSRSQISR